MKILLIIAVIVVLCYGNERDRIIHHHDLVMQQKVAR
jgi:hypothetical protein